MSIHKAVFIDRDGTINLLIDRGENSTVDGKKVRYTAPWKISEFKLIGGIPEVLEKIRAAGFLCILVTNQPDLAYKTLPQDEHKKIMDEIRKLRFDDIFICPHGRTEDCDCKKPKPGLLLEAAQKWNIDLPSSFMIGDMKSDMEAGRAAGCTTILIPSVATKGGALTHYTAPSLSEAVALILTRGKHTT